jgi:hypothetical protein
MPKRPALLGDVQRQWRRRYGIFDEDPLPPAPGGTGTVTQINTTAPITGGPITTTGTIGVTDFVASGPTHARGTVPDPGATPGTSNFLREDATWAVPASSGAPADAAFVMIGNDARFSNERALAVTAPMTLTDGGANASATIATPTMVASGASHARGLTPDTPATAGTLLVLREDGTWADLTLIPTIVGGGLGGKRSGLFDSNTASFTQGWGTFACATVIGTHTNSLAANRADSYLAQYWQRMTSPAAANSNVLACQTGVGPCSMWFGGVALSGGFYLKGRAGVAETWVSGWASFWGLRASIINPAAGANPSSFVDCVGIGFDAADANMQVMNNDAAGTCTKTDLGASFAIGASKFFDYEIYAPAGTASFVYRVVNYSNGAVASGTISTNTPTAATVLQWTGVYGTNGATAVAGAFDFGGAFFETTG